MRSGLHNIIEGFVNGLTAPIHTIEEGFVQTKAGGTLFQVLTGLGLTTNLKLCLDAGASSSYDPAVQTDKWLDISGNGYDFFLGSGTGADAADPTFNGNAGGLSANEYWSFDGGDYFTYDTTNETWMDALHKDNAMLTAVGWVQIGALGGTVGILGTSGAGTGNIGCRIIKLSADTMQFAVFNAGTVLAYNTSPTTVSEDVWVFIAVSLTEATGADGTFIAINSTFVSATSTYTSPSAAAATFAFQIGAQGNAVNPMPATSRMAELAVWQGTALSQDNITSIYNATRGRFGV